MERTGGAKSINLFAVEVSKFCVCHRLVLTRENDARKWFYFFVKEPSTIEFGDRLLLDTKKGELFLDRGPMLMYRAILDEMHKEGAKDLIRKLPYRDMYPEDPDAPWCFIEETPQG